MMKSQHICSPFAKALRIGAAKQAKQDALVMLVRTQATTRGATPAEIQRNVLAHAAHAALSSEG